MLILLMNHLFFVILPNKVITNDLKHMYNNSYYLINKLAYAGILLTMVFTLPSCSNDDDTSGNTPPPSYDSLKPIGFGANTTGGNNQNKVVVSTAEQLKDAVSGTNPATIYVKGQITLNKMLSVGSNKSIIVLSGASIINTNRNEDAGIFLLKGSENSRSKHQ